jgi:hypothetical protein
MGVVANAGTADQLAGVSDHVLAIIAKIVADGGLRRQDGPDGREGREGREGVVERVWRGILALSSVSKRLRAVTVDAVRPALALVMRIAPPQTLSNSTFLECINADPELSRIVLNAEHTEVESAGILSRLVGLSRSAQAARAAIESARVYSADDTSDAAEAARDAAKGAPKLLGHVVRAIESARPALRASLLKATIGSARMYPRYAFDADAAIEMLKVRPYASIPADGLKGCVEEFLGKINLPGGASDRGIEPFPFGPLCLWDVSAVQDFASACASRINFNSDLFWNTKSATSMNGMFYMNAHFKGYVGTWDVGRVTSMVGMFGYTAIEDSGIASWNTASLTDASSMFGHTEHLSKGLDLSGWKFGRSPDMRGMFAQSSIVDCGIGNWDVSGADTGAMLMDANAFTGSLEKWPRDKRDRAQVPPRRSGSGFGSARVALGGPRHADKTHKMIAGVLAAALRERGAQQGSSKEQCAIL